MKIDTSSDLEIGALPDLRIVSLGALAFHEEPDEFRFANVMERLRVEGMLKNPPIVAEAKGQDQLILLEGANRVSALLKWGFEHVLVQVVNLYDPLLALQSWHHAVEKLDREIFCKKLDELAEIRVTSGVGEPDAKQEGATTSQEMTMLCSLTFADGSSLEASSPNEMLSQVKLLKEMTGLYAKDALFDQVSYIDLQYLQHHYPDFRTLIKFRTFNAGDLLRLVSAGERLPAGLTRVFLPKRALGLNISLDFLRSVSGLADKNRRLKTMILEKVRNRSIRFYREPTFVFDK